MSRDDECNVFSYGPFRPEKARKIESTDPRVSGGYGRRRRPRAAAGHQPGRRLTPLLSCLNETARFEVSNPPKTGTCPYRWACFGARTRERNDLEERPPDASHGCAHCGARFGPADADQRDRLRRLRAGDPERASSRSPRPDSCRHRTQRPQTTRPRLRTRLLRRMPRTLRRSPTHRRPRLTFRRPRMRRPAPAPDAPPAPPAPEAPPAPPAPEAPPAPDAPRPPTTLRPRSRLRRR